VIGRGSSGVVKKVLHQPSGGIYVLKVINFDMGCEQVRLQPQPRFWHVHACTCLWPVYAGTRLAASPSTGMH
jgi:hypothetical protein